MIETKITDAYSGRSTLKNAAIGYRTKNTDPSFDMNCGTPFVIDSNDGWFRKIEGIAKGWGLMIRTIQVRNKKPFVTGWGDGDMYKAVIQYEDANNEHELLKDYFWIYVDQNFTLDDVIKYVEENKNMWKP